MLSEIDCEIIWAKDGHEAVKLARLHHDLDLILMDMKMPIMNGYEATRLIREFNKTIKIIAQTAYALSNDRQLVLDAGCDDYITKPININKLMDLINVE